VNILDFGLAKLLWLEEESETPQRKRALLSARLLTCLPNR